MELFASRTGYVELSPFLTRAGKGRPTSTMAVCVQMAAAAVEMTVRHENGEVGGTRWLVVDIQVAGITHAPGIELARLI